MTFGLHRIIGICSRRSLDHLSLVLSHDDIDDDIIISRSLCSQYIAVEIPTVLTLLMVRQNNVVPQCSKHAEQLGKSILKISFHMLRIVRYSSTEKFRIFA